jgi:hypothetical protein
MRRTLRHPKNTVPVAKSREFPAIFHTPALVEEAVLQWSKTNGK